MLVIANNGFNIFGSLMLGGYAAWVFEQRGISGALGFLFSVFTVLVMLLGEILPKALGSRLALPVSLAAAPLLHWLGLLLSPLVLLLERLLPAITQKRRSPPTRKRSDCWPTRLPERPDRSRRGGDDRQGVSAERPHRPRSDDTAGGGTDLDGSLSLKKRALLLGNNDDWWVVLGDQVDKVLGVASRERLLTALLENRGLLTPVDLCEPVEYVPEMIRADRLLTGFRRDSGGVRVVVDEFGGFVGVIGAESVLAVLAGWWRKPAA